MGFFLHQYVKSFLRNMVGVVSVDLGTQELPGNMSVQNWFKIFAVSLVSGVRWIFIGHFNIS